MRRKTYKASSVVLDSAAQPAAFRDGRSYFLRRTLDLDIGEDNYEGALD